MHYDNEREYELHLHPWLMQGDCLERMNELKPCPFCGAETKVTYSERDGNNFQIIGCSKISMICPNPTMTIYKNDDGEFDYQFWNTRVKEL